MVAQASVLEDNRQKRLSLFRSRYVGAPEAASFDSSTFRKLYAMVRHLSQAVVMIAVVAHLAVVADGCVAAQDASADHQIARENQEYLRRIKS